MNEVEETTGVSAPQADLQISLLVLQASPFCNINCDYCYLPDRQNKRRMPFPVLERTMERVFSSGLIREGGLTVVWHAGEPLALPISYYKEAFDVIERLTPEGVEIRHSMQTNGTLINQAWCEFIKEQHISIGLSIDGPADLHDRHRVSRTGRGTHAEAMRGLRLLQQNEIHFHVISVITGESLGRAGEIFDFFLEHRVPTVGFNVEEAEGIHEHSSLDGATEPLREFMETLFRKHAEAKGAMRIREFDHAFRMIAETRHQRPPAQSFPYFNEQARPFGIVNVDCDGNFSCFSPELLGQRTEAYGPFLFGSVDDEFVSALNKTIFQRSFADIYAGILACEKSCPYYAFCGGGAPANKLYENGTFNSTETLYCRHAIQIPLDIVLGDLERLAKENAREPAA